MNWNNSSVDVELLFAFVDIVDGVELYYKYAWNIGKNDGIFIEIVIASTKITL